MGEHADEREVRQAELGVEDVDGKKIIVPKYNSYSNFAELLKLMQLQEWKTVEEFRVAELSPADLFARVQNISINGHEYDPVGENCQRWIKELASSLGHDMEAQDLGDAGGWGYCLKCLAIQPALKCHAKKADKKDKPTKKF